VTPANLGQIGQIFVWTFLGAYFCNVKAYFDFKVGVELVGVAVASGASVPDSVELTGQNLETVPQSMPQTSHLEIERTFLLKNGLQVP